MSRNPNWSIILYPKLGAKSCIRPDLCAYWHFYGFIFVNNSHEEIDFLVRRAG